MTATTNATNAPTLSPVHWIGELYDKAAPYQISIGGEIRTVLGCRPCYGNALELRLNRPLCGYTSRRHTIAPCNLPTIAIVQG